MVQIINRCFLLVSVIFFITIESSNSINLFDNLPKIGYNNIRMVYYKRSPENKTLSQSYLLKDAAELIHNIDLKKPFVLYIHGYITNTNKESTQTVISAYLQKDTDNIIALDWSSLAYDNYFTVGSRVKKVAKITAKALTNLAREGLNVDTLHVIGHSLGAQIAGLIGQYIDFKIPRVTGLDPAYPMFYNLYGRKHVDERSGQQVDILHTDGGHFGAPDVTGSVDFFPNGGTSPQPNCKSKFMPVEKEICSHQVSWRIWAESVNNEKAFPAVKCGSYGDFTQGKCDGNHVVYYGYALPKQITGKYFFTTNSKSPFGKSMEGIKTH